MLLINSLSDWTQSVLSSTGCGGASAAVSLAILLTWISSVLRSTPRSVDPARQAAATGAAAQCSSQGPGQVVKIRSTQTAAPQEDHSWIHTSVTLHSMYSVRLRSCLPRASDCCVAHPEQCCKTRARSLPDAYATAFTTLNASSIESWPLLLCHGCHNTCTNALLLVIAFFAVACPHSTLLYAAGILPIVSVWVSDAAARVMSSGTKQSACVVTTQSLSCMAGLLSEMNACHTQCVTAQTQHATVATRTGVCNPALGYDPPQDKADTHLHIRTSAQSLQWLICTLHKQSRHIVRW